MRGGTINDQFPVTKFVISIHPPRAGRDRTRRLYYHVAAYFNPPAPCGAGLGGDPLLWVDTYISIHPPRAGRDGKRLTLTQAQVDFNPPAPCGAGRPTTRRRRRALKFQSTRPVRGGTHPSPEAPARIDISIHPPRAGRDVTEDSGYNFTQNFNPPAPCGAGRYRQASLFRH